MPNPSQPMSVAAVEEGIAEILHDSQARRRLETLCARLGDPRDDVTNSLAVVEKLRGAFSHEVRSAFRALRDCPNAPHGVIVRDVGRDRSLPATPADAELCIDRESYVGEWILLTLASSLGTVISYREQRAGQLFNNIVPVRGSEDEISSQGSRSMLGLHRECTFSEAGPDFLGLYCHRGGDVATYVASAGRIQSQLTERHWDILREPRFATPLPPMFCRGGAPLAKPVRHCIFTGDRESPEIRVDATLTRGTDADAEAALEELRRVACHADVLERVTLGPGDVLFLDNRKCLHGREAFAARFDGFDRWLVRLYVKADVWACRERLVGEYMLVAGG